MIFTKEHEGQIIFGRPTGNNARGKGFYPPLEKFFVIKVNRKYIKMDRYFGTINSGQPENYCPLTGATQKDINSGYTSNSGYQFFESLGSYESWVERQELVEQILATTRAYGFGKRLEEHSRAHLNGILTSLTVIA
jgi:hypothetical protein